VRSAQAPSVGPTGNPNFGAPIVNNVNNSGRPEGNSEAKALRRLRKDRPDLHAQVRLLQELSDSKRITSSALAIKPAMPVNTVL
jgi:hypothetical protein